MSVFPPLYAALFLFLFSSGTFAQTPAAPAVEDRKAQPQLQVVASIAPVPAAPTLKIPVDSPAMVFSPGNWTGDVGRGGKAFRQTWNAGAYFRVSWTSPSGQPAAKITIATGSPNPANKPQRIAYNIDGIWKIDVACTNEITIEGISERSRHDLTVLLQDSPQKERWGSAGVSPVNVLRVTGVLVDEGSQPVPAAPAAKWALIVGDSITEGIGASALASYSHLLGQALRSQGHEYAVSACGWSGWINKGDNPPGDVPGYFVVTNSVKGEGGEYQDPLSRWNKIDGNGHSLLDAQGRLSAYGQTGGEPALILINYGTNDGLHGSNASDTQASITQALAALRRSAPDAQIILLVPFNQAYGRELKVGIATHKKNHPADDKVALIDLGQDVKRALDAKAVFGGLHPNDRGHANFAAQIIPQVLAILQGQGK